MLGYTKTVETDQESLVYLYASKGLIKRKNPDGTVEEFNFVEGTLSKILKSERVFQGETVPNWYLCLVDGADGEEYAISFPYASNLFKSLVLSLSSATEEQLLQPVRIETYLKDEKYTNATVRTADGNRLDWVTKELPPLSDLRIGERVVKDDSARMAFIENLVEELNAKIGQN